MATKKTPKLELTETPESAFRSALLMALRAGNPDYNLSLKDAARFRESLAGLGIRIDAVGAIPTVTGPFLAEMISEEDLQSDQIPADLPLNLHCRFQGRDEWHNMGLLTKMLRPGTPAAFRLMFANIFGAADPAGRTASDVLLSLPAVNAAVQKYLDQE